MHNAWLHEIVQCSALHIVTRFTGVWALDTHNLPSQAKLPNGTKNVRFVGIAKKPYTGDMAIDSVLLSKKGQAHSPLQLHSFI